MAHPVVSMDEAGQTGENLLDAAQPVFTLASVDFDAAEALSLVGHATNELQFVKARRQRAGRARILDLLNSLPAERVRAVAIHKPFMVTCKIVDQLVEPLMYDDGIDGYADGSLLALANLWHFTCESCVGPSFLSDLHRSFVHAVRHRDISAVNEFYTHLEAGLAAAKVEVPALREMSVLSRGHFESLMDEQPLPVLEPGVPAAQALVYQWAQVHSSGFEVRHDHRNEINEWIAHLGVYYDASQPAATFSFPDGVTVRLPVPVTTFGTGLSEQHPAIQIADVVASAATYVLRQRALNVTADEFAEQLAATPVLDFVVAENSVWPSRDFLESAPSPGPAGEFNRMLGWLREAERS